MEPLKSQAPVTLQREDRVAIVTLDRGDGRNALNLEAMTRLRDIARELSDDAGLVAVILRGGSVFSAGADLSAFPGAEAGKMPSKLELREMLKLGPAMCRAWEEIEAMTIGAIEGYCVGGAAALAATLDYRVLGRSAFFRLPEVPLGINMSWQTLPRLVAQIGPARAKQYAIFGKRIAAETALEWGLCEELTDDGEAFAAAGRLAEELRNLPPMSVRMTKQTINAHANALNALTSHMDRDQYLLTAMSEDFQEGVGAFLQRRKPVFKGN